MKKYSLHFGLFIAFAAITLARATDIQQGRSGASALLADIKPALESITSDDLLRHIKVLASDEFEGRAPGTKGEELTVSYLIEQFKQLGLKPGNPDGTYMQKVPLAGFTAHTAASFRFGGRRMDLKSPDDYVALSRRFVPEVKVEDSEMVFVGYGTVAPEFGWDDYKDEDVKGKTVVILSGDPPIPDPNDPRKLDDKMFKGRAMTYYGLWTYKRDIASEKGAAAMMIVHESGPAGFPYESVVSDMGRENFDINASNKNLKRIAVESFIHIDRAKQLFAVSGRDFDDLKKAALSKSFKPVPLGAKVSFNIKNTLREIESHNVIAKIEGADAKFKDEYVIYTAHWDHLGRDEKLQGDQIYNGAIDNASGISGLLELAEAYTKLKKPARRSILFLAVTAEEQGMLGAKFYTTNPLYPLERTLANINIHGLNVWGRTKDIISVGYGSSTLDDLLSGAAATQGRTVKPDPVPGLRRFYKSDQIEFAKAGIPVLFSNSGNLIKSYEYFVHDLHKVSDEVKSDWDLSGAVEDLQLLFQVGYGVAEGNKYPEWKPGTEFKARREEMLKRTRD